MAKKISFIFILITTMFYCRPAFASHMAGGELLYTWVSDSTYKITFKMYRDCSGISQPFTVPVCLTNSCDTTPVPVLTLYMPQTIGGGIPNGTPIDEDCPNYPSTCNGGIFPNYQEWWYESTITLPTRCSNWTFRVYLEARNPDDNLVNSGNVGFYVEATLNNLIAPTNSSAQYTIKPEPFVCDNQPYIYNNGAVDINNDSLGYELIQPKTQAGISCTDPVTDVPFSDTVFNLYNNPLPTNNTFTLDSMTGEMHFTPDLLGNYSYALRVTEYRNQVVVGTTMRDIQVHVISCNIAAPNIQIDSTTATIVNNRIEDCVGNPLHFCFKAVSPNPSAVLVPSDNSVFSAPGATVTYSGVYTDSIYGCVTWVPGANDTGLKGFVVSVIDSSCNAPGVILANTYSIPLYIRGAGANYVDSTICAGTSLVLSDSSVIPLTWSVLPGGDPVGSLSCATCNDPTASPVTTTTYLASATINGCTVSDTFAVAVVPAPATPAPTSNSPVCQYDSLQLYAGVTASSYAWTGPNGFTSTDQDPVMQFVDPFYSGTYYVTAYEGNCSSATDSVVIVVMNAPRPIITVDGALLETDTFASYQWYLDDTAVSGATSENFTATRDGYYTVMVTDAQGCTGYGAYLYTVGLPALNLAARIRTYPNPATTAIYVDAPVAVNLALTDMTGRSIIELQHEKMLNISSIPTGVYLLKIADSNGRLLKVEKVVKVDH